MADPEFQALLRAVRRHLWLRRAAQAARLSLWISAALMVVASVAPWVFGRMPPLALATAVMLVWAGALAWTAVRRPSLADGALWADRQLQGRSAFGTLLELEQGPSAAADTPAARHLKAWATAQLPRSRRLLAERREPDRLLGPLLALLTCAALAALMQALVVPTATPDARAALAAAATASASTVAATPAADEPSRVAMPAANADATPQPAERQAPGAAAPGTPDTPRAAAASKAPGSDPAAFDPLAVTDAAGSATAAEPATLRAQPAGDQATAGSRSSSSGREAGEARGEAPGAALSRPMSTPLQTRGAEAERRRFGAAQADSDEAATYDDAAHGPGLEPARNLPAVAAATPPAAGEATRLTASETEYVQAWMRARSPAR